jgi:hypothetical protein
MAEVPRRNEAKMSRKKIEKEGKVENIIVQRLSSDVSGKAQIKSTAELGRENSCSLVKRT